MRTLIVFALSLTVLLPGFGQSAAKSGPSLPKDPHEVLTAAAPYYDFASPEMKPWHLKASYQFYDLKGNAAEQGTWEYWWVAPKVHRSSFTRAGVEHTTWFTADGAVYSKDSGGALRFFEETIEPTLLSPLPRPKFLESGKIKLELKMLPADKPEVACVFATPQSLVDGKLEVASSSAANYYCFDPATSALRMTYRQQLTTQYRQIVKVQGRYLGQQVVVSADRQKRFTVSVETIESLSPTEATLTPPADATLEKPRPSPQGDGEGAVTAGAIVKKPQPIYPGASKAARDQGVVLINGRIGTDGKLHDLEVVAAPSPLLAEAAMDAVKHWEYKPYLLYGVPVEVETLVNVMFVLGH